uniref:PAXX non-homologous end joining factor n=1 Tax=Ornithorhynchus anatinus TaxID=9258 RepID=A0A6I8PHY3_ORNAN
GSPAPICSLPHRNLSEAEAGRGRGPGRAGRGGSCLSRNRTSNAPPHSPQRCLRHGLLAAPRGPSGLTFELPKLPDSEARPRLQALMLELAERVRGLERRRLSGRDVLSPLSPRPACRVPSRRVASLPADSERRRGGSGPGTRKRMPGESLINPGFKSKKAPSGVDFDDS